MKTIITTCLVLAMTLLSGVTFAGDPLEFEAKLSGDQQVPPVDTRVRGEAKFEVNEDYTKIDYELEVKTGENSSVGLLGVAGAHIHCVLGENDPAVAFLAGVIPGGLDGEVEIEATLTDANIVNDACGATIVDLVNSMLNGYTYVNVHSVANPAGEVRGQITLDDD